MGVWEYRIVVLNCTYSVYSMPSKADVFSCVYLPSVSPPQRYVYHVVAPSCLTVCDPMDCTTPGFLFLHHLLELAQTHVHWVSDVIQPSHPLSSPSPPAFSLSQHQGLFQELALRIRWSKYWSFSFSISPSNEHSGLIFSRIDWFDLLALEVTLKSFILQHHSLKTSIL